jgi:hypothetical protein
MGADKAHQDSLEDYSRTTVVSSARIVTDPITDSWRGAEIRGSKIELSGLFCDSPETVTITPSRKPHE